uniref:gliding motility-associated C-terminal domain-containing protein n=1 Tax=Flavobacterium sp. TaxID=239 RepID=UPI0037C19519
LISDVTTPSTTCANAYQRVRTWNFTDGCGNTSTNFVQTITVQDTTAPVVTTTPASLNATLECSNATAIAASLAQVPVATDNCTLLPTINLISDVTTPSTTCANAYQRVRTWNFTDGCGNTSTNFVQTITVQDTTAPVVTTTPASLNATLECSNATAIAASLAQVPVATDNCTLLPTINLISDVTTPSTTCANAYQRVRTWNFTDGCGNTSTNFVQTITVQDTTAPVVTTVPASLNAILECSNATAIAASLAQVPVATDNCTALPTINLVSDVTTTSTTCANAYQRVRTWNFTDGCGNTSTNFVQTITVQDTTAPVVTGILLAINANGCTTADAPAALTTVAALETAGLTISDNCTADTNLVVTSVDGTATGNCPITFTRTYTIKDGCNNTTTAIQTITINDTAAPVIIGTLTSVNISGCPLTDPSAAMTTVAALELAGVTISDNCTTDANLVVTSIDSNATGICPIVFTRTYTIKDACNNAVTTTQTITISDTTPPDFSGILPQNITLECNQTIPSAPRLTATDNCTSVVTVNFTEQNIQGTCPNNYSIIRTWVATDICGNSQTHTQQITIQDTTPPVFVGSFPTIEVFAKCDGIPEAPVLTATDNCGSATVTYSEVKIDGDCTNKYRLERTWTATDSCGNETEITQTVYLACYVTPYNALSPDGDGLNDVFIIEGLECYPNNTVQIVNRWGVIVFDAAYYDNVNNVFRGFSDGRSTISRNEKLPTGDYWYILKYEYDLYGRTKENIEKIGYIYIQNE